MEIVYGSRVSPFTGPQETKQERLTIYQEDFVELLHVPEDILTPCRLFGPHQELDRIKKQLGLRQDPDFFEYCLYFPGDTRALLEALAKVYSKSEIELINSDSW